MTTSASRGVFDLEGRVAVITGGAGLLGQKHAEAIADYGGIPVLLDLRKVSIDHSRLGAKALAVTADITDPKSVREACATVLSKLGRVDILINNAANNPKIE